MCESTVKVHVRNIMKKLKAKNRTQVAFLANQMLTGSSLLNVRDLPAATTAGPRARGSAKPRPEHIKY